MPTRKEKILQIDAALRIRFFSLIPKFNSGEFAIIKNQADLNSDKLSAKEWVEKTNAIGLRAFAKVASGFDHVLETATILAAEGCP